MNGTIIVPINHTATQHLTLAVAALLARRMDASLHLTRVHFTPAPIAVFPDVPSDVDDALRDVEYNELQTVAALLDDAGVTIETKLLEGLVPDTIARYAQETHAHFIVMDARPRGTGPFMRRGTVEQVIRDSHIPTIVVPAAATFPEWGFDPRLILVALDGSPRGEDILGPVVEVARATAADVLLLHLIRRDGYPFGFINSGVLAPEASGLRTDRQYVQFYLDTVAIRLREHGVNVRTRIATGHDASAVIEQEALLNHADLIAFSWDTFSYVLPVRAGHSVTTLVRRGTLPLLLCNGPIARCTAMSTEIEEQLAMR